MNINMPTSLAGGRYQLGQLVGRGGMAEVHVATDTRLGRTVAVKICLLYTSPSPRDCS